MLQELPGTCNMSCPKRSTWTFAADHLLSELHLRKETFLRRKPDAVRGTTLGVVTSLRSNKRSCHD